MSACLPSDADLSIQDKKILKKRFLIGQPVNIGQFAVLRIALGATLTCQLDNYGSDTVLKQDIALIEKINLLVTNYSLFNQISEV